MGKAAYRARKRRVSRLREVLRRDPDKFALEWSKRLASWKVEVKRRAGRLVVEGKSAPEAFADIEQAMKELREIGEKAFELEGRNTEVVLADICSQLVAQNCDHRMYRYRNDHNNLLKAKAGYRTRY